jgi:transcriptional regulator with GAF, ATPase, and Fis domain/tetratricopeptide (TPR) repeat protein
MGASMNAVKGQLKEGLIVGFRYQIEELLGFGDTGDVYACRDLGGDKANLVIKILSPHATVSDHTEGLSRELALMQRVRHPNLVRILDFGVIENSRELFLIEERIDGKDLYSGTMGMDPEKIAALFVKILKGLQYLHARGIVHGSLKPSNILLTDTNEGYCSLKLLDFNLRFRFSRPHRHDGFKNLAYTAPEILLGNSPEKASDLYAVGILIYQSLLRRLPFEDEDRGFLIQKQLQGDVDIRPLEKMKGGVVFSRLLRRMLEKDPVKRMSSANEVIAFLDAEIVRDFPTKEEHELDCHFSAAQFVGREMEMQVLQNNAKRVQDTGRGWTVFITGEAGSGKTRCMEELRSWARLAGWRVVEGSCSVCEEYAYSPYRQMLDATEPRSSESIFPLDNFLGIAESDPFDSSSGFAVGQFQDRLTRELVQRLADKPTIILLHDFHWADKATCAVLDFLSSDIHSFPVLLCVSMRPCEAGKEILNRIMNQSVRNGRGEVLSLKPLTQENIHQLIAGMTEGGGFQEFLGGRIFRTVGGNPFFLEEMLKHLAEQGALTYKSGKWEFLEPKFLNYEAPAGIDAILQKRISSLSDAARSLGAWLSLFHRATTRRLLSSAMSLNEDQIEEPLMELVQRQMVCLDQTPAEETIDFSHELIAEGIRSSLSLKLSQKMHSKIAATMENELGVDGRLHELAMHYVEGTSSPRSVRYALASADQYRSEFSHENALRCFEHVFQKRNYLTKEELCTTAISASDTMFALGMAKQAIQLLDSVMGAGNEIAPELLARMYMQLALSYQYVGDFQQQEIHCHKGLRILQQHKIAEPNLTKAMLWAELAFGYMIQSRPQQGLKCLARAQRACPEQDAIALQGRMQSLYASLYCVSCNLQKALAASEMAASVLSHSEESYLSCSAYSMFGFILMRLGRFQFAMSKHHQAVSLSEKSRSVILKAQALGNLAECLCRIGRVQEALNTIKSALESVHESNNPAIHYGCDTILAEIQFVAGDYRGAHQTIESLVQKETKLTLFTVGHALYLAAELFFYLGSFSESLRYIELLYSRTLPDAPFYEYELAQALQARIVFEQGSIQKALDQLRNLDQIAAKKHWPYHRCLIKMHLCEVLISQGKRKEAERYAKDALRLANAMNSTALRCHGHLLLGLIYSPVRLLDLCAKSWNCDNAFIEASDGESQAIEALLSCCQHADPPCPPGLQWRALAELSFIYRLLGDIDRSFQYAQKSYNCLCKLEDQIPADLITSFYAVFNRSLVKLGLVKLIEAGRNSAGYNEQPPFDDDNARILLRMSASINSSTELSPLLERILDQLLSATSMDRGFVFLRDEITGNLALAKGRNSEHKNLFQEECISREILEYVSKEGSPIISANVMEDIRIKSEDSIKNQTGKLFCGALKVSNRIFGVLYSDHTIPAKSISANSIDIFAASCNLAAMAIDNIMARRRLASDQQAEILSSAEEHDRYPEIIGKSIQVAALKERINLAAASPLDILIAGESGTGKELVARAINRTGRRRQGKFIPVDCGSLSDSLAEAELFGYRKGAFTGAVENRQGLLEAADGGIIFLDEISNMPLRLQAKLLRVLQEREVRRLGETAPRKLDIQVIAATNKDLAADIKSGQFRGDLYYRLKSMEIRLPSLRERYVDIPLLIEWFLGKTAEAEGGQKKHIAPESMQLLLDYSYPGNVRELRNIVASAYYSTPGSIIGCTVLPPEVFPKNSQETPSDASIAEKIYCEILEGKGGFDDLLKAPFLKRQFGISVLQEVIQKSLMDANGFYREALKRLGVPHRSYSVTIQFLKRHRCYPDFRLYRQNISSHD